MPSFFGLHVLVVAALVGSACMPPPPIPDAEHKGWQGPNCYATDCHVQNALPLFHDGSWSGPDCAECHGGNGACSPKDGDEHTHASGDDCIECHENQHEYEHAESCQACHYAEIGTRDCPLPTE